MSMVHLLEDFGDLKAEHLTLTDQALEDQRLEAFERGYQAGWEDASKAHAEEQGSIGAELARNLQDLSFTFHEAQTAMMGNLEPLFHALLETVLPAAARDAFQARIVEELTALAREVGGGTIVLTVAASQTERIQAALDPDTGLPVSIQGDDTLGDGQAFLRIGQRERMIDIDATLDDIRMKVSDFFQQKNESAKYGGR